jgi:hypothetical protein
MGSDSVARRQVGWRDDALTDPALDSLGRGSFARQAARLIDKNHSGTSSLVYGLEGAWGSGKSTVVNFVEAELAQGSTAHDWRVVHFTPWATSGTDALLSEFFSTLSSVAPDNAAGARLRERVLSYAQIARPLTAVIPVVGAALAESTRSLEEQARKPWDRAFSDVSVELTQLGRSILVIVDDIDRLQASELLDLLKVVRLLGRFPGVDFLLAYDERTVVETLQDPKRGSVSRVRARAFMEKIVQYPLSLPPLLRSKILNLLDAGLTEIMTLERVESGFEKRRFSEVIQGVMPSQLSTPRAVNRFLAQVRSQFDAHDPDEVNDLDLILATFLRVQFPDLFDRLQAWKSELTRGSSGALVMGRDDRGATDWSPLLASVGESDRADVSSVLAALFPAFGEKYPRQAAARRFGHPDYFDRYLAQAIPEGDIPDATVTRALLDAASGSDDELRSLVLEEDEDLAQLALSRIRSRYPDVSEPWRAQSHDGPVSTALLSAGMRLVDEAPERKRMWTSNVEELSFWMSNLLRRILFNDSEAEVRGALGACRNLVRRAHVIDFAKHGINDLPEATRGALQDLQSEEAEFILACLIADLINPTAADLEGSPFLYEFVRSSGRSDELRTAITSGIERQDFSIEDVAARFVTFSYVVGVESDKPAGVSFDGDSFTAVTGVDAKSRSHDERGQWPDTGLERRREYATRLLAVKADES